LRRKSVFEFLSNKKFSRIVKNYKIPTTTKNLKQFRQQKPEKRFLGAKSTSIRDCVDPSVRPPRCTITWKTSYVAIEIREEEEEEETDYVAIPLCRDSFAPRDCEKMTNRDLVPYLWAQGGPKWSMEPI
jgi:hypothetical protein